MQKRFLLLLIPVTVVLGILLVFHLRSGRASSPGSGVEPGTALVPPGSRSATGQADSGPRGSLPNQAEGSRTQLTPGLAPSGPVPAAPAELAADPQQPKRPTPEEIVDLLTNPRRAADAEAGEAVDPTDNDTPPPQPRRRVRMRRQSRESLERLVAETYGDLFAELKLSDRDTGKLKNMLLLKAMNESGPARAELPETEVNPLERALLGLLGEEAFAAYQDYEATVPGRWLVGQYGKHLDSVGRPLSTEQKAKLLEVVMEERQALPSVSAADALSDLAGVADTMALNLDKKDDSDAVILARASTFLSPDQSAGIKEVQARNSAEGRRSVEAYRTLFQGGAPTAPPAPAPACWAFAVLDEPNPECSI